MLIVLVSALIIGEIVAIALPPHMAVPEDIKVEIERSSLKSLANKYPNPRVIMMLAKVRKNPSLPVSIAVFKFKPKPNPTTDTFKIKAATLDLFTSV